MQLGVIGTGRMGANIVRQLLRNNTAAKHHRGKTDRINKKSRVFFGISLLYLIVLLPLRLVDKNRARWKGALLCRYCKGRRQTAQARVSLSTTK